MNFSICAVHKPTPEATFKNNNKLLSSYSIFGRNIEINNFSSFYNEASHMLHTTGQKVV